MAHFHRRLRAQARSQRAWIPLFFALAWVCPAFAHASSVSDCVKKHLGRLPSSDTQSVLKGISQKAASEVTTRLEGLARQVFPEAAAPSSGPMTNAQFNAAFDALGKFAQEQGVELTRKADTVGVFPEGLNEIALSGFDRVEDAGADIRPAGFAHRHELGHLFHALQVRAILLRSFSSGGRALNTKTRAQLESFLKEIEGGMNYLEFEEAVTGLASAAHGVAGDRAQSLAEYRRRISKILQGTREGLLVGKIQFATDRKFEEVYALVLSRLPLVLGKSIGELSLRLTPVMFGILYAQNIDVSALGIQPPGPQEEPKQSTRPYGLRDWVTDLLVELSFRKK
jgi:hypothetical protein